MNITRKIILAVSLILTACYLFMNDYLFTFSIRVFLVFIASFASIWGLSALLSSMGIIIKLHKSLNIIAEGGINYQAGAGTSREAADLAVSINEVGRKLRESADELEKRAILIERSNGELKRTEEHKSAYFSNIVHELRAPLINIEKNSAVLLEKSPGAINAAQENFLKIISNNTKRLTRLTDDLLDISRMESGRLSMKYESVKVKDIINDALNSVDRWRQSKGLKLGRKISPNSLSLYADRDRIVQVIVNLLSNAIKFTPPKGQILIEAKIFKNGIDAGLSKNKGIFIEISVADAGIGIPENQKEKIFERYKTVESKTIQTLHSTGLGLFIARQIVKTHGGRIWVESKVDKGSKFTFIIPQNIEKGLKEHEPQVKKLGKKVLVIDDEGNIRELLSRELNKKGYFVTAAKDGLDGLKKALDYCYDLVITDIRMPGIDGIKCIEVLKKVSPNTFFIVITGFSVEERLKKIIKKDAYPCIKKPFDLPQLLQAVDKRLSVSGNN